MDKKTLLQHSDLIQEVAALLNTLAGNLLRAEEVIRGTDAERAYNAGSVHWDAEEAVALQLRLQILRIDIADELDHASRHALGD